MIVVTSVLVECEKGRVRVCFLKWVICVLKIVQVVLHLLLHPLDLVVGVDVPVAAQVLPRVCLKLVVSCRFVALGAVVLDALLDDCTFNRSNL